MKYIFKTHPKMKVIEYDIIVYFCISKIFLKKFNFFIFFFNSNKYFFADIKNNFKK